MTHAADTALADELAMVAQGWSAQTYIEARAVAMRDAVRAGDHAKAERLAASIEALQGGVASPLSDCDLWQLSPERWAAYLIDGGYLVPRVIPVPTGSTPEQALAHVHIVLGVGPRTWACKYIRLEDITRVRDYAEVAA